MNDEIVNIYIYNKKIKFALKIKYNFDPSIFKIYFIALSIQVTLSVYILGGGVVWDLKIGISGWKSGVQIWDGLPG